MLLHSEFPPDIRVENEADSLLRDGHEVHLLCYNYSHRLPVEVIKGMQIHRFDIQQHIAKKSLGFLNQFPLFQWIWLFQIKKLLSQFPFDAIHIHDLPLCCAIHPLRKIFKGKIIADMHENYPYLVASQPYMNTLFAKVFLSRKAWFRKEKKWLKQADSIITVADEMKTRLMQAVPEAKNIVVVPNTLSFSAFLATQQPKPELAHRFGGRFVVSYIGGIDSVRGVELLLESVCLLKGAIPNLLILLVGDGTLVPQLKEMVSRLLINDYVQFEGWQPAKFIQAYIEQSMICAIPHLRSVQTDYSSPNKIFQYMYFGKPVITSNCISLEKLITETKAGLVFEDKNVMDLAEKIKQLFDNPSLSKDLGENGRQAVNQHYNWDATCQPLLDLYR